MKQLVLPVLAAAGLIALLIALFPPGSDNSTAPAPTERSQEPKAPSFPAPPSGAVVFAREDGENALALAVSRSADGRSSSLQSSVVGPQGTGVSGLPVGFTVTTPTGQVARAGGTPCGPGCYSAVADTGAPRRVTVAVGRGAEQRRFLFVLPRTWPPPDATTLVRRSGRVWRRMKTLVWRERLASSPDNVLRTVYRAVAPSSLSYRIAGGAQAVVIGGRRWDRDSPTASWQRSSQQPPLQQPVPFWSAVRDAHVVGSAIVRGRPVWRVTFFDPRTPGWFTVALDKQTLRTLELRMVATAHFMHHVYGPFNEPLKLEPPR
jgi:hypothetical protein